MWTLNVRFPPEFKDLVDEALKVVNARPSQIGEAKVNDFIVHAVKQALQEINANRR